MSSILQSAILQRIDVHIYQLKSCLKVMHNDESHVPKTPLQIAQICIPIISVNDVKNSSN